MKPKKPKPIANRSPQLKRPPSGPGRPRRPLPSAQPTPLRGVRSANTPTTAPEKEAPMVSKKYKALIFDADRFIKEKDYETAFEIYQKACDEAPPGENHCFTQICRCYRKLAKKALKKDKHKEVIRLLEDMLERNGKRPNLKGMDYKVLGLSYYQEKDSENAKKNLEIAIDLKPDLEEELRYTLNEIKAEELSQLFKKLY